MQAILDLERYPLDQPDLLGDLIVHCRTLLRQQGMFNLDRFVRQEAVNGIVNQLTPLFDGAAFTHARSHNIYFSEDPAGLPGDHPALTTFETINHTLCADQFEGSALLDIYQWPPLIEFLAAVIGKGCLYPMQDPLASVNVMRYGQGEALNWHFDRSEFTTTLLLQAADRGGEFQYVSDLRSEEDQNYEGVGAFLTSDQSAARTLPLDPGTLNVFLGRNTAHRVSPVEGNRDRMVVVFSYYDKPGVRFSDEELLGFYGRTM